MLKQKIKDGLKKLPVLKQLSNRWNFIVNKLDEIAHNTTFNDKILESMYYGSVPNFKSATIELTNICKYNCFMCPRDNITRKTHCLEDKDIILIANRLSKHLHKEMQISTDYMGDVLALPNFLNKVTLIKKYMPKATVEVVSTLGYKKQPEFWSEFFCTEIDKLRVSFYAYNSEYYKQIHGYDGFEIAKKNLIYILQENQKSHNPIQVFVVLNDFGKENEKIISNFDESKFQKEKQVFIEIITTFKHCNFFETQLHNRGDSFSFKVPTVYKKCFLGNLPTRKNHLFIDCELNVLPCCMDYNSKIIFGNLRYQTLEEIYESEAYKFFYNALLNQDFTSYPLCKGCSE